MHKLIKLVSISSLLVVNFGVFAGISGNDVKTEKVLVALNKSKLITLDKNIQIAEISQGNTSISTNSLKPDFHNYE